MRQAGRAAGVSIRLLTGDCRETLPTLDAGSVQAVITSPPYYGLRDYGLPPLVWGGEAEHVHSFTTHQARLVKSMNAQGATTLAGGRRSLDALHIETSTPPQIGFCACGTWLGSLGLEPTPDLFVEHMVEVFRHVKRVLRDDGVLWLNLGDSYAGSGKGPTGHNGIGDQERRQGFADPRQAYVGYKAKDLMMMPFRVAMALQADGWWLRSVIPWLKRNSMPESVTDRPATAVEYVFLLSKSARYFWDADAVRMANTERTIGNFARLKGRAITGSGSGYEDDGRTEDRKTVGHGNALWERYAEEGIPGNPLGRNRRNSDWFFESWQGLLTNEDDDPLALVVNPAPFSGSHFATFPPKLIEPMIKASTSEQGQCPECGAPWVRVVERGELVTSGPNRLASKPSTSCHDPLLRGTLGKDGYGDLPRRERSFTGWRPSCAHADLTPVPQTILDPLFGAGTVGLVADRLQRNAIGCELKPEYAEMGTARIVGDAPLFAELETA